MPRGSKGRERDLDRAPHLVHAPCRKSPRRWQTARRHHHANTLSPSIMCTMCLARAHQQHGFCSLSHAAKPGLAHGHRAGQDGARLAGQPARARRRGAGQSGEKEEEGDAHSPSRANAAEAMADSHGRLHGSRRLPVCRRKLRVCKRPPRRSISGPPICGPRLPVFPHRRVSRHALPKQANHGACYSTARATARRVLQHTPREAPSKTRERHSVDAARRSQRHVSRTGARPGASKGAPRLDRKDQRDALRGAFRALEHVPPVRPACASHTSRKMHHRAPLAPGGQHRGSSTPTRPARRGRRPTISGGICALSALGRPGGRRPMPRRTLSLNLQVRESDLQ